jgi:hypothetical protein
VRPHFADNRRNDRAPHAVVRQLLDNALRRSDIRRCESQPASELIRQI